MTARAARALPSTARSHAARALQGRAPRPTDRPRTRIWLRVLLLVAGGASLAAGLDAALVLLGLPAPVGGPGTPALPGSHGALMVFGVVGTLGALERAVALRRRWGYVAPALLGLGALAQLAAPALGLPQWLPRVVVLGGAVLFALVYVPLWRRQRDPAVLVQALGAVVAAGAAGLLAAGVAVAAVVPWLAAFVLATIAGERLELARVRIRGRWAEPLLVVAASAVVVLCPATLLWPAAGYPLFGAALLGLAVWVVA